MSEPGKTEPLMPKWLEAKKKSEGLSKNPAYKPDMTSVVKRYDQLATVYDNLMKEKEKLPDILKAMSGRMDKSDDTWTKLDQQRVKIQEDDNGKFQECDDKLKGHQDNPEADPAEVLANLDTYVKAGTDYVTMTKSLNDQISKLDLELLIALKKGHADYKAKSEGIVAGVKKIENDGKAVIAQIKAIGLAYQNIAAKLKDTDTIQIVRDFLAEV